MSTRRVKFKEGSFIELCPKCGNKTEFVARSEQVMEDGCEVWIECKCGYNPFTWKDKLEDVWGGVHDDNVMWAINVWNNLLMPDEQEDQRSVATGMPNERDDGQNQFPMPRIVEGL